MYADRAPNGAQVGSVTQSLDKAGGIVNTGRGMDAMIQGRGFYAVRAADGQVVYTRVGQFNVDKDGFVVDSAGRKLQGYGAVLNASGQPVAGAGLGALGDLKVATDQIAAQASTQLQFSGNLSADWTAPTNTPFNSADPTTFNSSVTSVVYDSLGKQHSLTQYFVSNGVGSVSAYYSFDGAAVNGATASPNVNLSFNTMGQLTGVTQVATATTSASTATFGSAIAGAAPLSLSINYANTTQFAGSTSTLSNAANGYTAGIMTGTSIGDDGSVTATYSNGQKQVVGTVALATFADESALNPVSDTSWSANGRSGPALYSQPGAGAAGKLQGGALEQSNVDITSELVNLMTNQELYQANSKAITTQNQVLQALMQAV